MTDQDRFQVTIDLEKMDPRIRNWMENEPDEDAIQKVLDVTTEIMVGFEAIWGNRNSWPVVTEMMAQAKTTERKMLVLTALNRILENARNDG